MRRRSAPALAFAGMVALTSLLVTGCTGSARPPSAARSATTAEAQRPGVLADCTAAAPQRLAVEPASITVACADAGIGARHLVWRSWNATAASGSGKVWENDCTPDCADGTVKLYPASIALSTPKPSRDGPTFTVMTATYNGAQPNGHPTDRFALQLPLG